MDIIHSSLAVEDYIYHGPYVILHSLLTLTTSTTWSVWLLLLFSAFWPWLMLTEIHMVLIIVDMVTAATQELSTTSKYQSVIRLCANLPYIFRTTAPSYKYKLFYFSHNGTSTIPKISYFSYIKSHIKKRIAGLLYSQYFIQKFHSWTLFLCNFHKEI